MVMLVRMFSVWAIMMVTVSSVWVRGKEEEEEEQRKSKAYI